MYESADSLGNDSNEIPLVCLPQAIPVKYRRRHLELREYLIQAALGIEEASNGYRMRFQNDGETIINVAEFVTLERLCCPFLRFTIDIAPGGRAVWLFMTGAEGAKEVLAQEMGFSSDSSQ
jgi:hypothetical protein